MWDCLTNKHRNHLKAGFNGIAGDSMNTAMRQRILGKLSQAYYGRMEKAFDNWKYDCFADKKAQMERMKAKVIDEFIRNAMSPIQKSFLKWARWMRHEGKIQFGNQVKAGFALTSLLGRYLKANRDKYQRYAWRQLYYDEDKVMERAFQKMIRAAGVNFERAFLRWRMFTLEADRSAAKRAKKNNATLHMANVLDKKRKNHLRSGVKPLANGVAHTKMQSKIFNRMYYILHGRLKTAFRMWTEELSEYKAIMD